MDKKENISLRVLVIAGTSARRAHLAAVISRAVRGVNVTCDSQISPARFAASKADILVADLDTPASAAAMLDFLQDVPTVAGSVALIDDPDPAWVRSALRASVHAIISRDVDSEDMQIAIQAAEAGFVLLHPTSVQGLLQNSAIDQMRDMSDEDMDNENPHREEIVQDMIEDLTARESEVLRLVSMGLGNKEIAARLAISEHTAKFHISSILGKLNAASRTEAVSLGIRKGLIPI
ncbi:MAG TPA: response regulator transcription factor [Candidatus Angelobacter sp.]|nr:response regulator transcription factor [Candidatus Angelobacter sp.]